MTTTSDRRFFGIWKEDGYDDIPSICSVYQFIKSNWNPTDLKSIVAYLEQCPLVCTVPTSDVCVICDEQIVPYGWHSDGIWLWKSSLPHYIRNHSIVIPKGMLSYIRDQRYITPAIDKIDLNALDWPFGRPGF